MANGNQGKRKNSGRGSGGSGVGAFAGGVGNGGGDAADKEDMGTGPELGSCEFNVALINRMEPSDDRPDLKSEPTFGQDRWVKRFPSLRGRQV